MKKIKLNGEFCAKSDGCDKIEYKASAGISEEQAIKNNTIGHIEFDEEDKEEEQ